MNRLPILEKVAESIGDEELRRCVTDLLREPRLGFADMEPRVRLEEAPASPRTHHSFPGGLVLHTLAVAELSRAVADVLSRVYGIEIDRDLVVAAALLHDIFKFYQYERSGGGFRVRRDSFIEHGYAVVAELVQRGCPWRLVETVAGAHARMPVTRRVEALVVHLADLVDAVFAEKLQEVVTDELVQLGVEPGAVPRIISAVGLGRLFEALCRGELGRILSRLKGQAIDPSSQPPKG